MTRRERPVRGDVNAILNRFVREGLITGFETNLGSPIAALAPHVRVTANLVTDPGLPGYDRERLQSLRAQIATQLEPLLPGVVVSVRPG